MPERCGFFFFPGDWKSDPSLSMVSEGARLLWFEMLCVMSENDAPGFLQVKGRTPTPIQIAALTRTDPSEVESRLAELEEFGVFSRDKRGVIYSRKMVRDEKKRRKAQENGKLGGNPNLGKQRGNSSSDNPPDNGTPKLINLNPSPSLPKKVTESSSSPSESPTSDRAVDDDDGNGVSEKIIDTLIASLERKALPSAFAPRDQIRQQVDAMAKSIGSVPETERILLEACRRAQRDPLAYANRIVAQHACDLAEARRRGEVDPNQTLDIDGLFKDRSEPAFTGWNFDDDTPALEAKNELLH